MKIWKYLFALMALHAVRAEDPANTTQPDLQVTANLSEPVQSDTLNNTEPSKVSGKSLSRVLEILKTKLPEPSTIPLNHFTQTIYTQI